MVAGPNGSGKSTLTMMLAQGGLDFGQYLNADDIARGLTGSPAETASRAQQEVRAKRDAALAAGHSYTFETVMSHPSHIEHLRRARLAGFETRLIFVATDDPSINRLRVANRVEHGGHDVPLDRIEARYHRCLANLPAAIRAAKTSMIFDNSRPERPLRLLAEINDNHLRHMDVEREGADSRIVALDLPFWWLTTLSHFEPALFEKDGLLR